MKVHWDKIYWGLCLYWLINPQLPHQQLLDQVKKGTLDWMSQQTDEFY